MDGEALLLSPVAEAYWREQRKLSSLPRVKKRKKKSAIAGTPHKSPCVFFFFFMSGVRKVEAAVDVIEFH